MINDIKSKLPALNLSLYLFLFILILPIAIVAIYQGLIATDRYESLASIYITEAKSESSPLDLSMLGLSSSTASDRDILVLKAFIESPTLLDKLNEDLGLLDHFASSDADFFSRLSKDTEREYALEYYNEMVTATLDEDAKLLEISVQTFDPAYSQKVLDRILYHSQKFIDNLNEKVSRSQLLFFEGVVQQSEEELMQEKKVLQDFQQKNKIFSTEIASQTIAGTISSLEQQLAAKQAEITSRQGTLGENSPTLIRLRAESEALKQQIEKENERLAGGSGRTLSEIDSEFRDINLRIEYKTLRYKSHLEALEAAQLETARRMRFLTIVSAPTMPEASLYPRRGYNILTGAIIALMVYFMVSVSLAVMREHA
nr:hypothetical protein [uncultured Cohaesibacter sp.]